MVGRVRVRVHTSYVAARAWSSAALMCASAGVEPMRLAAIAAIAPPRTPPQRVLEGEEEEGGGGGGPAPPLAPPAHGSWRSTCSEAHLRVVRAMHMPYT